MSTKFLNYIHKFVKDKALLEAEEAAAEVKKNGWETAPKDSPADFSVLQVATKGGKEVAFESPVAKKFYQKEFAGILPLDDIIKFINPSGIKLEELSVRVGTGENTGTLSLSLQGKLNSVVVDPANPTQNLVLIDMELEKDGDKISKIYINHAHFPAAMQKQNVLRDYFKHGVDLWEAKGVQSVELTAGLLVGGHSWAKYGFDFKSEDHRKQYTEGFKKYAKMKKVKLGNPDGYQHAWEIAAQSTKGYKGPMGEKIGKEFMLGMSSTQDANGLPNAWQGVLDLTPGSPGRIQLNAYLNGTITKADARTAKKKQLSANPQSMWTALQDPKPTKKKIATKKAAKKSK